MRTGASAASTTPERRSARKDRTGCGGRTHDRHREVQTQRPLGPNLLRALPHVTGAAGTQLIAINESCDWGASATNTTSITIDRGSCALASDHLARAEEEHRPATRSTIQVRTSHAHSSTQRAGVLTHRLRRSWAGVFLRACSQHRAPRRLGRQTMAPGQRYLLGGEHRWHRRGRDRWRLRARLPASMRLRRQGATTRRN